MASTSPTEPDAPADGYCGGRSCAAEIAGAIAAVSGRWAIRVLEGLHFAGGASRFRQLQRQVGAISSKELSRQLVTLSAHGIVEQAGQATGHRCYRLTPVGRSLMRHMQALGEWARERDAQSLSPCGAVGAATWLGPICYRPATGRSIR